jgi:hypothetical protein
MSAPELSVVVTSHGRPLRLRWLMNALEQQTLDSSKYEVIVDPAGWRLARAPMVVFIDDELRPPRDWLANVLEAVRRHPDAVIRGPLHDDPDERAMLHAPFWRTAVEPQCNVVCPREMLEGVGEDAIASAAQVEEQMLLYRAIDDRGLPAWLGHALHGKVSYNRSHAVLPLALAALALQKKYPPLVLLVVPWAVMREPRHHGIRGRIRHLMELPGWAVVDAAELAALAAGSVRHRSLVL